MAGENDISIIEQWWLEQQDKRRPAGFSFAYASGTCSKCSNTILAQLWPGVVVMCGKCKSFFQVVVTQFRVRDDWPAICALGLDNGEGHITPLVGMKVSE